MIALRGAPESITSNNGSEFAGQAMDYWAHQTGAGRFKDQVILIGIDVPADFNVTCPTGPHILPQLIPMNPNGAANDRAAGSVFGPEWQYFSRPFVDGKDGWGRTSKDVKAYLWHVKRILETL